MQNQCAEIKLRAERRAGELLAEMEKNPGTKGQLVGRDSSGGHIVLPPEDVPTLADLGISRMQSHRSNVGLLMPTARATLSRAFCPSEMGVNFSPF